MKKKLLLLFALLFAVASGWAQPITRYVNPNGNCGGNSPCYTNLSAAINDASDGDIIQIDAVTFSEPAVVNLNKPNITIKGMGTGLTKIQVSGTGDRFDVSASGITIRDLSIEKTDKTGEQNIIRIRANNFTLQNTIMWGRFAIGDGEVSRAIVVNAGSYSGILITGNTFYDLRQPMYLSGTNTGTVSNNYTYNTKGWVLEGGNLNFTGNTWGVNVYDIAIVPLCPAAYYADIVAMSNDNNQAVIEDQRVNPAVLSVVYVDASTSYATDLGGRYHPYSSISPAITRSVAGGKINVAAGTYTEALTVNKSLTFIGSGPSSNPTTIITSTAGNIISLSETAKSYTFQNLIVEGNTANNGIRAGGSININALTMEDVILRNCQVGLYLAELWSGSGDIFNTTTVSTLSFDNVTLTNNKFIGAYIGKTVLSGTIINSTITGNGYSSDSPSGWQKTGLQFVNFDEASVPHVVVTNCTFTSNGVGASSIERTGLSLYTAYNTLSTSEILTVSGCSFTDHPQYAVRIKNGSNVGNTATVNGTFTNNYLDIWFRNIVGSTSSTSLIRRTFDGTWNVGAGPTYDYNTIQAAIDASTSGYIINVYPGNYNQDEANGWNYLTGLPGDDNFNIFVNKSITIQGVDESGLPITDCHNVAALVIPKNDTPLGNLSTIFVQADNVIISGLDITAYDDDDWNFKTISVIGENVTIKDCKIHAHNQVSSIYMYDPRYNGTNDVSYLTSYTIQGNYLDADVAGASGIRFSSGAGWSGNISNRKITGNHFSSGSYGIEYAGPNVDGWDYWPIGASTITNNAFTGQDRGAMVAWGLHDGAEGYGTFDWDGIFNGNIFDKAVIVKTPGGGVEYYEPTSGSETFHFTRGIYSAIQRYPVSRVAKAGDIIHAAAGTYDEQVIIDGKSLTLQGAGDATLIMPSDPTTLTSFYTYPAGTFFTGTYAPEILVKNAGNVVLKDLKVDGTNVSTLPDGSTNLAGILYAESSGTIDDVSIHSIKTTGYLIRTNGIDLSAVNGDQTVEVKNCLIDDCTRNSILAQGADITANVHNNVIVGPGAIGPAQLPNGILFIHGVSGTINSNTISNGFYNSDVWGASGILVYDPVNPGIVIENNDVTLFNNGIAIANGASGVTVKSNNIHGVGTGVDLEANVANNKIFGNTITQCTYEGIYLTGALAEPGTIQTPPGTGNEAYNNKIYSNTAGITNKDNTKSFLAINNWWGAASGPLDNKELPGTPNYNNPSGLGNPVSSYVDYAPWSTTDHSIIYVSNDIGNDANEGITAESPKKSIQAGVNAVFPGGTVNVAAGSYPENVNVTKALTLIGANANIPHGTGCGTESVIAPATGLPVLISADGVTINGFEITAPSYTNAIVGSNYNNLDIKFNYIHHVGSSFTGGNVHAIFYSVANGASKSNVKITDNTLDYISSSTLTNYSASAIGVIQSPSTGILTGLNIERNSINNVIVNTGNWPTGKIAYGIQINLGGSESSFLTTGKVSNAVIANNEISNLTGFIATGIGLEGNTENAVVRNNTVSTLTGYKVADRPGGGYDVQALKFECNRYVSTCTVENNSFLTNTFSAGTISGRGYAIANYVVTGQAYSGGTTGNAVVAYNWLGSSEYSQIQDNEAMTGKIFDKTGCKTVYIPWYCDASMLAVCAPPGAIINTTTGTAYAANNLGGALSAAADGQTLFIAEGSVNTTGGTVYNFPGKTVYIIGTGFPGQSIITGSSPALTVSSGQVIAENGITFYNATDAPTILVTGGNLTLRNCIVHEAPGYNQSCLRVTGGTVDAGLSSSNKGNNQFFVHGTGSAVDNQQAVALPAEYNDWGSAKGPTIGSNSGGDGGSIIGTGAANVDYAPFGGGPITTIASVTVCSGATTVDIPVTVTHLSNVGSFSLKFKYDVAKLYNPQIVSRNAAFDAAGHVWDAFEFTTQADTLANGVFKVSGLGANPGDGISLTDNEVLFTLRFSIGTISVPGSASLVFNENSQGTACEFTGVAPTYPPYGDVPQSTNYINGSVSVVADPVTTSPLAAQTLCIGGTPANLTVTASGGTGTFTYQWYSNSTASTTGSTLITGATAATYTPPTSSAATIYYYCVITQSGVGCDPLTSGFAQVIVVTDPTTTSPLATQTLCIGGTPANLTVTASGGTGTFTYQWYSNSTASTTGSTLIAGATTDTYTPPTSSAATIYYYCVITQSGVGCDPLTSGFAEVIVVADPIAPALTKVPNVASVCSGATLTVTTTAGSGGTGTRTDEYSYNTGGSWTAWSTTIPSFTAIAGTNTIRSRSTNTGSGCESTYNEVSWTVNARQTISGTINYLNLAKPALTHEIQVQLVQTSGTEVLPITSSDNPQTVSGTGGYSFTGVCPSCSYDIRVTSTHATTGAVNTTDAAQVNYWGVHAYEIEKVRFYAGDVNQDETFTAPGDAQKIQLNFVNGTPFIRAPWTFWSTNTSISTNPLTINSLPDYPNVVLAVGENPTLNLYGLVTGDFNMSFDPTGMKASSSTLDLVYTNNQQIGNNTEFELPVRMVNASEVGAVSLILNYPAELVEVQDVTMPGAGGQLQWGVNENELRISWMSGNPISLAAMQDLLVLKLKTTAAFTLGNTIRFTLAADPLNEMADAKYDVIGNAVIGIDLIEAVATGIDNPDPETWNLEFTCYPNPFSKTTTISYTLPFDGQVTLEVYNFLGMKVEKLVSEEQTTGKHVVKFNTAGMESGVFTATLTLKSNDNQLFRTIKLVNNK